MMVISMIADKDIKVNRILTIYSKLIQGEIVHKKELAEKFNVSEKTIQRDLEDIRLYFYDNRENLGSKDIIYKRDKDGYCIDNKDNTLTREDVLVIIKILLASRAFCKSELKHLFNSVLGQVDNKQKEYIQDTTENELFNYVPVKHDKYLLNIIWNLSELIRHKETVIIKYEKIGGTTIERKVEPVSIIFSEFYFYLIAYISGLDFDSPAVFRVDRIKDYKSAGEKFYIADSKRFKDGEFRKKVQFMYPGKLIRIKFEYTGSSVEAVLDKLPTARIIESLEGKYVIEAEIYGTGIIMWILSQGKNVKVIYPLTMVKPIEEEINKMQQAYSKVNL